MSDPPILGAVVPGDIQRVMELARRHLGMDLAYVAAFEDGIQKYQVLEGDAESFGMAVGTGPPLDDTYCARMVEDSSLRVVPDSSADGRVRDLPITRDSAIGSYVGVPITLSDGTVYGTFCCLSHEPDPTLTSRDADFMGMLAELVAADVEVLRGRDEEAASIRKLLRDGGLVTALQPIVDLGDGHLLGVEALSRFPAGYGPPDVVFAAAHRAGLGLDLERLAIESAVGMLSEVNNEQFVAINVAPDVARELAALATPDLDVPLDRLVLEITEHAAVESYATLREALQPLRERGLRVAIDDAGAGFASLHHVVELGPDIVKIDRSLIDGLSRDPVRRSVVSSFVLLGLELDALVLAEGLEDEDDLATAKRLGVRAGQGYLFARPSTDPVDHRRWAGRLAASAE